MDKKIDHSVLIHAMNVMMRGLLFLYFDLTLQVLNSVCRIGDVLLSLQKAGNVKYTGWIVLVPCSASASLNYQLQEIARNMEGELNKWNDAVIYARHIFYELNYFTTTQILVLRRELGALNSSAHSGVVPSHVLFLLHSLSSCVNSDNISQTVKAVVEMRSSRVRSPVQQETPSTENADESPARGSLDQPVVGSSIKPDLKFDSLTDEQRDIVAYVVQRLHCSKLLVLKAFEEKEKERASQENPEPLSRYKYEEWCSENLHKYDFKDDTSDEEHNIGNSDKEDVDTHRPTSFSYLLRMFMGHKVE